MPTSRSTRRWWTDRGLSIACLALYAVAQIASAVAGWLEYLDEQRAHQQAATVFGPDGYAWTFLEQTLQNWQSEFLALGTLIALTSVLIHRGSKHSRDGTDEIQRRVQAVERRVEALARGAAGARG
jgi:hypothetical protein